jgi:hypothetical protein
MIQPILLQCIDDAQAPKRKGRMMRPFREIHVFA